MQEVLYALRRVHEAEVCDYERIGVDMKLITGLSAIWPGRRRHAGSDRDPGRASVGDGGRQIAWTAIGLVWYQVIRSRNPQAVANAGRWGDQDKEPVPVAPLTPPVP